MRKHIAWRLALIIPTLLAASVVIFVVMRALPGDVALVILGGSGDTVVNPEVREALEEELGLNDPLVVQYGRWLWSMVSGEFGGRSLETREPIRSIVGRQLPVTALLTGYTILLSVVVSLPLGVLAAARSNRLSDYVVRLMTLGGLAIPSLWVALLTILCLLIFFRWSPPLVYAAPWSDPWVHLQKMVWPAAILAWEQSSHLVRVTRSSVLEALNQTYITTARGKGLPERSIVLQHAVAQRPCPRCHHDRPSAWRPPQRRAHSGDHLRAARHRQGAGAGGPRPRLPRHPEPRCPAGAPVPGCQPSGGHHQQAYRPSRLDLTMRQSSRNDSSLALSSARLPARAASGVWAFARARPVAFVAILVLGSIVTMALLADAIATHDPVAQDVARRLRPPGPDGYFGTDGFGRDVFSRVVHGSRASLYVGLLSVGIASVAGIGLGTLSAYWSGPFDLVVQRAVDTLLGFPLLVLAIVMVVALGPSANSVVVAIALALAPQIARLSRASALYVKEELYMDAARVIGAPPHRVILRHLLPNSFPPVLAQVTGYFGAAVVAETALSFLGLGVPPPFPSWGRMLQEGSRQYFEAAPWATIFPGLLLSLTVLSSALLGDALRDLLDPRSEARRAGSRNDQG